MAARCRYRTARSRSNPRPRPWTPACKDRARRDRCHRAAAIGGRGAETLRLLARRRHIPFLAESAPQEGGVYLGPDNFTAGRELGRVAGKLLTGKIKEVRLLLVSLEGLPNTRARCDGFIKGFGASFKGRLRQWRIDGAGSFASHCAQASTPSRRIPTST